MAMEQRVFYLHEDEWAMITILPAENLSRSKGIAQEANEFSKAHFDGFGWTNIYVIPEEKYPLSERQIPFSELSNLLSPFLAPADIVQTGYSSYRETVKYGFAYISLDDRFSGFYGEQKDGIALYLHLLPGGSRNAEKNIPFVNVLSMLGSKYNLILADWWLHKIVDLRDSDDVMDYFGISL